MHARARMRPFCLFICYTAVTRDVFVRISYFSYEMTMLLSLPMLNFAHESRQRLPQCHGSGPQAGIGFRETINTYK